MTIYNSASDFLAANIHEPGERFCISMVSATGKMTFEDNANLWEHDYAKAMDQTALAFQDAFGQNGVDLNFGFIIINRKEKWYANKSGGVCSVRHESQFFKRFNDALEYLKSVFLKDFEIQITWEESLDFP